MPDQALVSKPTHSELLRQVSIFGSARRVQFGSLLALVAFLTLRPARYPGTEWLVTALAAYAVSKVLESEDQTIYHFGQIVSGHTLKHLLAAAGVGCLALRAAKIAKACKNASSSPY